MSSRTVALKMVEPNQKVLICGCGFEQDTEEVDTMIKKNCDFLGIDIDSVSLSKIQNLYPNRNFKVADMITYSEPDTYDCITCLWNTINYVQDLDKKKQFIKRCEENLKDGGKLIMTTSHIFHRWRYPLHNIKHFTNYFYYPSEIDKWFEGTQFKVKMVLVEHANLIIATKWKKKRY